MKKLLVPLLAAALILPCLLIGCNQPVPQETTPAETTEQEVTTPPEETVQKVTMSLSHVTVTAGDSAAERTAVAELTEYLEKRSITVSEGGYPIVLCIDETVAEDGYRVEAVIEGDSPSMTIRGGNGRGILYGVYGFLEEYAEIGRAHV